MKKITMQWEETGEVRCPKQGEWYLDKRGLPSKASFDFSANKFPIIRLLAPPEEKENLSSPAPWKIGYGDGSGTGKDFDGGYCITDANNNAVVASGESFGAKYGISNKADAELIAKAYMIPSLLKNQEGNAVPRTTFSMETHTVISKKELEDIQVGNAQRVAFLSNERDKADDECLRLQKELNICRSKINPSSAEGLLRRVKDDWSCDGCTGAKDEITRQRDVLSRAFDHILGVINPLAEVSGDYESMSKQITDMAFVLKSEKDRLQIESNILKNRIEHVVMLVRTELLSLTAKKILDVLIYGSFETKKEG